MEGLLDAGADPNFSTLVFTPFMHAASKGHTKLMQVRHPLHPAMCARGGSCASVHVEGLEQCPPSGNETDVVGGRWRWRPWCMQLLRERGADSQYTVPRLEAPITIECENCSKVSSHDFNSLHTYQCPSCKQKAFEFSEAHACVGMSPMHAAAAKGQTKAVQWLLQHGLSINAHTSVGDTPLMMAVMGGHRETVEHMLENNAEVAAVNADGDSALHRCPFLPPKRFLLFRAGRALYA